MKILFRIAFLVLLLISFSCNKEKSGTGTKISSKGDSDSHNVGTACIDCHGSTGDNEYWFSIAGTVYKPDLTDLNPGCTIFLFPDTVELSAPIYTLQGDSKGNFYSTEKFSYSNGLYPAIKSISGEIKKMKSSVSSGNCNSCHNSGNRIFIN